jgi:hypothetical protein
MPTGSSNTFASKATSRGSGQMTVHDIATLADLAAFNPNDLHLVKRRSL